jgi:hypothetical protein
LFTAASKEVVFSPNPAGDLAVTAIKPTQCLAFSFRSEQSENVAEVRQQDTRSELKSLEVNGTLSCGPQKGSQQKSHICSVHFLFQHICHQGAMSLKKGRT